jgi:hypothetical protein
VKREKKGRLSAKDLRELGADPERARRMIPPDGPQRVEAGEAFRRRTKRGGGSAPRPSQGRSSVDVEAASASIDQLIERRAAREGGERWGA